MARDGRGPTLAEVLGFEADEGGALAALAEAALEERRPDVARAILEGLVLTNPLDAGAWAVLSRVHRRAGRLLAARLCAEVGVAIDPEGSSARLALAESLLASGTDRSAAREALRILSADDRVGARARALLAALPE